MVHGRAGRHGPSDRRGGLQGRRRRVIPFYVDRHVRRSAIRHAPDEMLGSRRTGSSRWRAGWYESRPASISLTSAPSPGCSTASTARVARSDTTDFRKIYSRRHRAGRSNWTIVGAPTPGWARTVFGEPDVERLWEAVATAMRLDAPDPVEAWREQDAKLPGARPTLAPFHAFDAIRYRGPGLISPSASTPLRAGSAASGQGPRPESRISRTSRPKRSSRRQTVAAPRAPSLDLLADRPGSRGGR